LPVPAGVPVLRGGLRRRHRLGPVHRDPGDHDRAVRDQPQDGALHLMKYLPFSARHLFLAPLALVMATPLIWMLITSIEPPDEARHFPPVLIPSGIDWHNYTTAISSVPFGSWYLNSVIVCFVVVLSNLVLCSLAGYTFARIRFFGSNVLFVVLLATLMVPFQVILIPTFLIVRH